ncbi:MAG TPA: type I methionyl aminopeptidase [Candidatus Limnocylindrales bacterium]|nr:type I methionyl aminopeptidase [Candidatus Limnocylindrales bacterium]
MNAVGFFDRHVTLKSGAQIERMAVAGRVVGELLDHLAQELRPGLTTEELDDMARAFLRERDATPSFIGEPGPRGAYRHALCISIDAQVVHGVPGRRRIAEGQIVSIDAGAIVDGWHGDAARSFVVGEVPEASRRLVEATREAMAAGIAAARPGNHLEDIAGAVEDVALAHGYGVVRAFVGHGIGTAMHEEPQVTNYRLGRPGRRLEVGLCLAIEPMFTLGDATVRVSDDGWTVVTADGSLAAHWEHSIAVTASGPRILTVSGAASNVSGAAGSVLGAGERLSDAPST